MENRRSLEINVETWKLVARNLQDHYEWLCGKEEELKAMMPIGGDLQALQRQCEEHKILRDQINER